MISIKNLHKSFGSNKVLTGINLTFEKGKVYGVVGANGAGKTTLFRCIADLESYDGSIDSNLGDLKDAIGYLPTQPIFMSRITGWEYLKLLSLAKGDKQDNFESKNIFDLPLDEYAENYSTGMQKKLSLMGILLQNNEVYILDEPFNGVDIQSSILISEVITALKDRGKTVIISSHIFSTLKDHCDEINYLQNGKMTDRIFPEGYDRLEDDMKSKILIKKVDLLFE